MTREQLGQDARGRLVFGWCAHCLAEADCVPCEGPALPLRLVPPPPARRLARAARRWRRRLGATDPVVRRRLVAAGLAGLMCTWGLALGAAGLLRWLAPTPAAPVSGLGNGTAPLLLTGSAALCLLSLALASTALSDSPRSAVLRAALGGLVGFLLTLLLAATLTQLAPASVGWALAGLLTLLAPPLAWALGRGRGRSRAGRDPSRRPTRPERA